MSEQIYKYTVKWFQVYRGKMVTPCKNMDEVNAAIAEAIENENVSEITIIKIPPMTIEQFEKAKPVIDQITNCKRILEFKKEKEQTKK